MEDNKTIWDEATRICSEYKINIKSNGYLLGSSWMVSCDETHLMPKNFRLYFVSYNDIGAVYLLEKTGVLSIGKLSKEGRFPIEIDSKKSPPIKEGFRSHILERKTTAEGGLPYPSSLLLVYFNSDLVDQFLEKQFSLKINSSDNKGVWINKAKGEYQFPNRKIHKEKGKKKKKIFIEMMDLYDEKGIVTTSSLASRTSLSDKRTRTEINQISNKMSISVGYKFSSDGNGYYELRKLTD